jgi:hypothetical protein
MTALTRPLQTDAVHRRSSGPSLTGGYAVRPAQAVLRPPPTPTRPAIHFPGSPVIGHRAPVAYPQATGPGRASPVPAATLDTFRAPYAGEFLTAALPGTSPLPWPSPRFREARHSLARPEGQLSNDAAGFASCYGPHRRSPLQGFWRWAPTPPVSRRSRQPATGPPGSYPDRTHTGRRRRAYEHEEHHELRHGVTSRSAGRTKEAQCVLLKRLPTRSNRIVTPVAAGRHPRQCAVAHSRNPRDERPERAVRRCDCPRKPNAKEDLVETTQVPVGAELAHRATGLASVSPITRLPYL